MLPVNPKTGGFYALFFIGCVVLYKTLEARKTGAFDYLLTASAALQSLAFALLVFDTRSNVGEGLSEKTLWAFLLAHGARLSTTFIGEGYIPEDNTADVYLYQILELIGVLLVAHKLWRLHTMRMMHDIGRGLELWSLFLAMVAIALCLAFFTKSDGHNNFTMDFLWMFSVWLEAFALLPQVRLLFLTAYVDEAAVHFAVLTLGASLSFGFFWGRIVKDRSPEEQGDKTMNVFYTSIILAASIRVLLCAMYFYLFTRSARELKGVHGSSGKGEYEMCKTDEVVDMDEL